MSNRSQVHTIGIVLPDLVGTYCRNIVAGVYRVVQQNRMRLLVVQAPPSEIASLQLAWDQADGWVVVLDTNGADSFVQAGVPIVTVSNRLTGAPAVLSDNVGGMQAAVTHLISNGHRQIAFVYDPNFAEMRDRLAGYQAALAAAAIPFDANLVFSATLGSVAAGRAVGEALAAAGISFTALAAATDHNALGVMEALQTAGYRVPDDVAIVGFDDMPETQVSSPPLTTVRQRFDELGRMAAERLLQQIADPTCTPEDVPVATSLIVRRSCGALTTTATNHSGATPTINNTNPTSPTAWQYLLAHHMVTKLLHPVPLAPHTLPEDAWTGVNVMVATLQAALEGNELPEDMAIQTAWATAIRVASYADTAGAVLDALEEAAEEQLGTNPELHQRARVRAAITHLRDQLIRVCLGMHAEQILDTERMLSATDDITRLLVAQTTDASSLRWLERSRVPWACFAAWNDQPGGELRIAGTLHDTTIVKQRMLPRSFPPLNQLPPDVDVVGLVAVRTERHDWGILAIGTTYRQRASYVDSSRTWAGMLAARLDDEMLITTLEREQAELQASFERERALADTVRELGCPIIPIGREAILVPLIGTIDSQRARQIIDNVLGAVSAKRSNHVLLDVSGVPVIDTHVAGVLLQLSQMVALLGARIALIGIRPEIAQSIVSLGMDLSSIVSHSSLEYALRGR
jgi:anti-anti-sigma factor